MLKVNNKDTFITGAVTSAVIVNMKQISYIVFVFPLLKMNQ